MSAIKIFRRLAELLDITTYDLPANNTPLSDALAAKAPVSGASMSTPTLDNASLTGATEFNSTSITYNPGSVVDIHRTALGLGTEQSPTFAGVTASGTVEAASYTRGGVAQQDVSTGATPTFAGGVINGSLVVTSASYPVMDTIRNTAASGDYRAAVRLRRTNSSGTSLAGIGIATYFEIPNSANAQKFAGMFGGSLSTVTSGSEIGELVFSPAWNGLDPSFKRDFVLRATSTTTADATLAGNLTASGTVTGSRFVEGFTEAGIVGASANFASVATSVITATLTNGTPCTITLPTPAAGLSLIAHIKQAPYAPTTVSFAGAVWSGGTHPVMTATTNKVDIFSFVTIRNAVGSGWIWAGSAVQNITPT